MLPFLNMRLYRGNNLNLSKHLEKLKNNQLTIENVLEEDDIIQDLKTNANSQFISMLSNEAIRKLIDYATKMPSSDDQKIGHKFPFNAAEILCADNSAIQERLMYENVFKESDFYEEENNEKENKEEDSKEEKKEKEGEEEKKEEKNEEEKKEEKNEGDEKKEEKNEENEKKEEKKEEEKKEEKNEEEKKEEKKEEEKKEEKKEEEKKEEKKDEEKKEEENGEKKKSGFFSGLTNAIKKVQDGTNTTKDKNDETKKEEEKTEAKKEENDQETKKAETEQVKKEDTVQETKKEEEKKPEEKKEEEQKPEVKKEEVNKEEQKKEENKPETPEEKPEEKKEEKPEEKKEEKKEEKQEENKTETEKPEVKTEEKKVEETPKEEKTEEKKTEDVKERATEEPIEKKEEEKTSEEKPEEPAEEEAKKDNENEEDDDEEEKGQHKHFPKEDEDEDNQKENEENEDSEKDDDIKTVTIYDNVDYLFSFLKEQKETISNHVLVGYFYKILNHLISSQTIKIVQYIFDYPNKNKFDVLDALVKNLNRKSMGSIVNKLLLFQDDSSDLTQKKLNLSLKILKELESTTEQDKYECICEVLASTLNNKTFYISFMSEPNLVDLLFTLLEKSVEISKKLIAVINLLIKVNENVLKNFNDHCTKNNIQENPLDFMALFNYDPSYPSDDKQVSSDEMDDINKSVLLSLFNNLKKNEFKFLEDLGEYNQENGEFLTTYQKKQKKIGMKKIAQIEFLRTILDIFVNSLYAHFHEKEIEELVKIIKNKNIFYNCHKLFFDFPFSNIYQTYYNQIVEIIINQNSPNYLIECFFKYSDGKEEKNLVPDLMDHFLNNMKFSFNSSNSSFNPCMSYEITLLNQIYNTENENVKALIEKDENLKVFDEVLGEEINHIFDQKLLLSDSLGTISSDNEKPLPTFGKANFMEIIEEDKDIYNSYKNGEDYKKKLDDKRQREKEEKEKMEQEIVGDEEENKDEKIQHDDDEENEEGGEENGIDREEGEEGEENNVVAEDAVVEDDKKEKEENNEQNESEDKKSVSTEESAEDKEYNDVNYWNPGIVPNDDIMSAIINDIE